MDMYVAGCRGRSVADGTVGHARRGHPRAWRGPAAVTISRAAAAAAVTRMPPRAVGPPAPAPNQPTTAIHNRWETPWGAQRAPGRPELRRRHRRAAGSSGLIELLHPQCARFLPAEDVSWIC